MPPAHKLTAGLELNSRRFVLAVGQLEGGRFLLRATEEVPARGFERGILSDSIECSDTVSRLVRQAEKNLHQRVSRVLAAFQGNHLTSYNASASVPIPDSAVGIVRRDVERAIQTCRALSLDYNRQILHDFTRGFTVDHQSGIKDPVGLFGTKLAVEMHLVTALTLGIQNLSKVLNRAGLEVEELVLPALAAAEAVSSELDRDLGVTVVRVGEFQTEAVLFSDGLIRETFLIPWGTDHLIEFLAKRFKLARLAAEHLLSQVRSFEERPEETVSLRVQTGNLQRSFPKSEVVRLVSLRVKDFLAKASRRLDESAHFRESTAGVVMVGELASLEGFLEMSEGVLNLPVRLGIPRELEVDPGIRLNSLHTTAIGLLRYGLRKNPPTSPATPASLVGKWFTKTRRLLEEYF